MERRKRNARDAGVAANPELAVGDGDMGAGIEAGDASVSLDLIMRAFFATGATRRELQRAFGAGEKLAA